ncbi:uncharacterized protein PODANS_1_22650 [Podospora anserina S mat+]|uniref:Podospora anserina S mat+ genomic DNA chromosome 1, supercontig 6 n=1 Tax=Podospora anserina (strain S / ATCC MYA-4624 / DSM 980 / FGSC 10383) TaxID=515849 RepID=B2AS82_PODAN|nr:uncharacterized protein PODANS_1_22650 [Podospora anserina S mat+]CAP67255.1 unnamed protein product [Podospora anserina S mat+]CDP24666.1 Putative protein of unknown function [Podospora anserina S mat+]
MDNLANDTRDLKLDDNNVPIGPAPPPAGADLSTMFPGLPAGYKVNTGMTLEETIADLNKHPLFMTELDDAEENEELAALQSLAYDGTPLENGLNFKEQGNECFKAKKWADAKEFYGKGVQILQAEEFRRSKGIKKKVQKQQEVAMRSEEEQKAFEEREKKRLAGNDGSGVVKEDEKTATKEEYEEVEDDPEETQKERTLLEQLYVNRAACHLELKNYRSCTLDCAAALRLNPKNVKAFYRSAKALLAVNKIVESDDACARGLEIDSSNAALQQLAKEIIAKNETVTAHKKAEEKRAADARRKEVLLKAALEARNIKTRSTGKPPDMEDAHVQLVPDPLDPQSSLSVPTMLLYPADYESDFIKAFNETESLEQHFGYVFPLPWDRENKYTANNVECYVETVSGGLAKVGKKVSLLKVLSSGNVEIVDDLLKIFVVPKGKAEGWVKDWKEKKLGRK